MPSVVPVVTSTNDTVPVGVPGVPELVAATVAVIVTDWPKMSPAPGAMPRVVVVVAGLTRKFPDRADADREISKLPL